MLLHPQTLNDNLGHEKESKAETDLFLTGVRSKVSLPVELKGRTNCRLRDKINKETVAFTDATPLKKYIRIATQQEFKKRRRKCRTEVGGKEDAWCESLL